MNTILNKESSWIVEIKKQHFNYGKDPKKYYWSTTDIVYPTKEAAMEEAIRIKEGMKTLANVSTRIKKTNKTPNTFIYKITEEILNRFHEPFTILNWSFGELTYILRGQSYTERLSFCNEGTARMINNCCGDGCGKQEGCKICKTPCLQVGDKFDIAKEIKRDLECNTYFKQYKDYVRERVLLLAKEDYPEDFKRINKEVQNRHSENNLRCI